MPAQAVSLGAPEDERLWERRMKVLTMRNAGATFTKIADALGVSTATVRKDLTRAYRDVLADTPEEMMSRQRSILLDITRANYPAMLSGDKDAAATILRALAQEAALFGLNAPTRVIAGVSDVEFAEQAAALISSIASIDPTALKELSRGSTPLPNHHIDGTVVDEATAAEPAGGAGDGDGDGAGPVAPAGPTPEADAVPQRHPEDDDDDDEWSNL